MKPNQKVDRDTPHADHWENIIIDGYCWRCGRKLSPIEEALEEVEN